MSDLVRIRELEKNSETKIIFSLTDFRGNQYVDVREFVESDTYTGFTKKGLRFNASLLDQFIENLQSVKKVRDGEEEPPPQEAEEEKEEEKEEEEKGKEKEKGKGKEKE